MEEVRNAEMTIACEREKARYHSRKNDVDFINKRIVIGKRNRAKNGYKYHRNYYLKNRVKIIKRTTDYAKKMSIALKILRAKFGKETVDALLADV